MRGFVAFLALLLVPTTTMADTPAPYDMYAILDVTGGAAFVGKAETQTLHAVEDAVNRTGGIGGRPIRYVIQDGQTNPVVVAQLFDALIAKGVPVIVGPSLAADCAAVTPRATSGPVAFCLTGSVHSAPGSYVFGSLPSSGDNAVVGIRYLRLRNFKRLASLNTTDASGLDGDNQIHTALALPENADVSLVAAEHFNPSDISVSAQIARIKASGAQAILCWTTGTPFGTALRSVTDAGLDVPVITHSGNASNLEMEQFASILPRQVYFIGYRFLGDSSREPRAIRSVQERFSESFRAACPMPRRVRRGTQRSLV